VIVQREPEQRQEPRIDSCAPGDFPLRDQLRKQLMAVAIAAVSMPSLVNAQLLAGSEGTEWIRYATGGGGQITAFYDANSLRHDNGLLRVTVKFIAPRRQPSGHMLQVNELTIHCSSQRFRETSIRYYADLEQQQLLHSTASDWRDPVPGSTAVDLIQTVCDKGRNAPPSSAAEAGQNGALQPPSRGRLTLEDLSGLLPK
jgi:hypothetical protein